MLPAKKNISLREAANKQKITDFLRSKEYLLAVYVIIKENSHHYSYRQFSQDLGFGFTNYLHLICSGSRSLTPFATEKICAALNVHGVERKYFLKLVDYEKCKTQAQKELLLSEIIEIKQKSMPENLDKNMLEYLSEWYHPTIREMINMVGFKLSPEWIAKTLVPNISVENAQKSIELLEKLGFIYKDSAGNLKHKDVNIRTGSVVRGLGVKKYHQEMLSLAKNALDKIPAKQRDFQAITVQLDEEAIVEVKDEINKFWRWLMERSGECKNSKSIYQLNLQLFPTALNEEKKNDE